MNRDLNQYLMVLEKRINNLTIEKPPGWPALCREAHAEIEDLLSVSAGVHNRCTCDYAGPGAIESDGTCSHCGLYV